MDITCLSTEIKSTSSVGYKCAWKDAVWKHNGVEKTAAGMGV